MYKRKNKYGAKKTVVDGIAFDSKAEAQYYLFLKKQGNLEFKMQVKFNLQRPFKMQHEGKNKGYRAIDYIADFVLYNENGMIEKVIDVKGFATADFKLKAKLFMNQYHVPLILAKYDYRRGIFEEKIV